MCWTYCLHKWGNWSTCGTVNSLTDGMTKWPWCKPGSARCATVGHRILTESRQSCRPTSLSEYSAIFVPAAPSKYHTDTGVDTLYVPSKYHTHRHWLWHTVCTARLWKTENLSHQWTLKYGIVKCISTTLVWPVKDRLQRFWGFYSKTFGDGPNLWPVASVENSLVT